MTVAMQRIAVIGSGISGLMSAFLLQQQYDVTLFEKNTCLGGHTRTITLNIDDQTFSMDTGFIVYNEKNYPILRAFFDFLGIATTTTDMSFSVSQNQGQVEYKGSPRGLFAQPTLWLKPAFWRMLRDIMIFNRSARMVVVKSPHITLGALLDQMALGQWFRDAYLLPMGGAIWSCAIDQMLSFPAEMFVRFFDNHGLLTLTQQPTWRTCVAGAQHYIDAVLSGCTFDVQTSQPVVRVERSHDGVTLVMADDTRQYFDAVVIATHSDQALRLLAEPSIDEKEILSAIRYHPNDAYVHTDVSLMPQRRAAWAAWNYLSSDDDTETSSKVTVSYWMNALQPLPVSTPIMVTLNPANPPKPDMVLDQHTFWHPVFDQAARFAQKKLVHLQGQHRTWYVGAYHRHGFHEDGAWSAVQVCQQLGVVPPWK